MTESENIRRLTEWMENPFVFQPYGTYWQFEGKEWNPYTSLEHARMLEDEVDRRGMQAKYAESLDHIVLKGGRVTFENLFRFATAKAPQRCEALLQLIEGEKELKGKEGPK